MFVHLADASKERGQYQLLAELRHRSCLVSYAYKSATVEFENYWNQLVHIHLAGYSRILKDGHEKLLTPVRSHLTTYADQQEVKNKINLLKDSRPRVIIDSGAFTAFTNGRIIDPCEYADWAIAFDKEWADKMAFLRFMNLDVIGDQEKSWRNQAYLERRGINPLPVVTFDADKKDLERAIADYDYFALGGLVPYTRQRSKLEQWLNTCFSLIVGDYKKTGVMKKVHLLGVTTRWVLEKYPCYSSDSSSWVACLRFGSGEAAGLKKIPPVKEGSAARNANLHVLRSEIAKYQKMEKDATNLWKKRGISWDEEI